MCVCNCVLCNEFECILNVCANWWWRTTIWCLYCKMLFNVMNMICICNKINNFHFLLFYFGSFVVGNFFFIGKQVFYFILWYLFNDCAYWLPIKSKCCKYLECERINGIINFCGIVKYITFSYKINKKKSILFIYWSLKIYIQYT